MSYDLGVLNLSSGRRRRRRRRMYMTAAAVVIVVVVVIAAIVALRPFRVAGVRRYVFRRGNHP